MPLFLTLLTAMTVGILAYTGVTVAGHGVTLVPAFFGPMAEMTWQGQFNVDFLMFLVLSGLWTAWRNGMTVGGVALGVVAACFGIMFLAPYLLYLIVASGRDLQRVLMGVHAGR